MDNRTILYCVLFSVYAIGYILALGSFLALDYNFQEYFKQTTPWKNVIKALLVSLFSWLAWVMWIEMQRAFEMTGSKYKFTRYILLEDNEQTS